MCELSPAGGGNAALWLASSDRLADEHGERAVISTAASRACMQRSGVSLENFEERGGP
jgi:hypothetical protein